MKAIMIPKLLSKISQVQMKTSGETLKHEWVNWDSGQCAEIQEMK